MQAITPHVPARSRPYAWCNISINPDPPRVGEITRIGFPLANPGPDEVIVERIDVSVANFGIGVRWETLPPLGPIHLPADPLHVEHAEVKWTPETGGHRCVRAAIHVKGMAQPCQVGRNLQVIDADAQEDHWRVPFHLGNPERVPAPIVLRLGGNDLAALDGAVLIDGRAVALNQPMWLEPREEVDAVLLLRAHTDAALHHLRTIEGTIHGRLIDGVQVTIRRPAQLDAQPPLAPAGTRREAYVEALT